MVLAGVLGLAVGLAAFLLVQADESRNYCQKVEHGIKENQSFKGIVNCYSPASEDSNSTGAVENQTELKCICRKSLNGQEQVFEIRKSS